MIRQVVLVGLSGSGKTSVARRCAASLKWELVDTDLEIERRSGRSIPALFREDGESAFRAIERAVLLDALLRDQVVIATGGGAVANPDVWTEEILGSPDSLVVWLDADPETLVQRLTEQAARDEANAERPLLVDGDPLDKLRRMRDQRTTFYARADVLLDVASRPLEAVAGDVTELARLGRGEESLVTLTVEQAASSIHIGSGARFRLAETIGERWPRARHIWIAVDANLAPHVEPVIDRIRADGSWPVHVLQVPPGEGSKSLAGVAALYDWMLGGGVERGDILVALGGGMIGDLAGFAAATVLRGVGLVQVPSTLLSMVDSSVGGKTGINHAAGKNLIGAFYQPPEVVIDPELLATLPERERRSGWAEIIKHAVIEPSTPHGQPPVLLDVLERNTSALSAFSSPILPWVIRRNVSLKASVVEADERESGIRAYLNLGHTIGHGVEAAGYALLHGEAVAVGLVGALAIARELDLIDGLFQRRIDDLLVTFGLPVRAEIDSDAVREKMASDKKKSAGRQRWVLPTRSGGVILTSDVPDDVVTRAIERVTRSGHQAWSKAR